MGKWVNLLAILAISFATFPAHARARGSAAGTVKQAETAKNASGAGPTSVKPATNDPAYVIGAEDVLNVSVWKEPDITQTVPVRPDGKISLPLLNDVQAAGLTPMQLSAAVTAKLKEYLEDPQVTVIVTQINSQRYYIMGEVTRAGAYPLLPNMTILQALSGAGGFTPYAKLSDIYLLRRVNGHQERLPFNYKEVINGKKTEENRALKAGDTIIVP